jgi:hypothetical protein
MGHDDATARPTQDRMSKNNPFSDLKSLRREDNMCGQQFLQEAAALEQEAPTPRARWRREFVRVPWEWAERLQAAKRTSSWRLAVLLLYENWRTGGHEIALSNVLARDIGLSCRSKSRGLNELENLDLIEVRRRPRTAPRVALKHLKRS